jgi:myo-inositol-1-phosphate synthase
MPTPRTIAPATGRLGVLTPGLGAVASTFIAGVLDARHKGIDPIGSVSQMARVRLGDRSENRNPLIKEFVPLAASRRPGVRRVGPDLGTAATAW